MSGSGSKDLRRLESRIERIEQGLGQESQYVQFEERLIAHSGPLPDPETLSRYEVVVPGFGQTLVREMELEGEHRRRLEVGDQEIARRYLGRGDAIAFFALMVLGLIALSVIGVGVHLIVLKQYALGVTLALGSVTVAGWVARVVTGQRLSGEPQRAESDPGS